MPPAGRLDDLRKKYELGQKIGQGGFGSVYKATRISDGKTVAIKKIVKNVNYGERECKFMQENTNQKFVKLLDSYYESGVNPRDKVLCLVMEFYQEGSLADYIKKKKKLNQTEAAWVMRQGAAALAVLHAKNTAHRDVTSGNFLIKKIEGEKITVHLADFGFVRILSEDKNKRITCCGTPGFYAPKVARGDTYGTECDIFSLGMVFYHMITGSLPPREGTPADLKDAVERIRREVSNQAADFFAKLIQENPEISAKRITQEPYIRHWLDNPESRSCYSSNGPEKRHKPRSASNDCNSNNHRFLLGRCSVCRVPDPKKENRDSAFESGDAHPEPRKGSREPLNRNPKPRRPSTDSDHRNQPRPRRTPSNESDHRNQVPGLKRTVSENDVNPLDPEWPLPGFGHLVPHTFASKKGRFILSTPDLVIAERPNANGYVDCIMIVKRVRLHTQYVDVYQPRRSNIKIPGDTEDPVEVDESTRRHYTSLKQLDPSERHWYSRIIKAFDIIAGRVAHCEFVNILDVHHLHAKLMYNGDFRLIFPSYRIFVLKNGAEYPTGVGDQSRTPMTTEEQQYFDRALDVIRGIHAVYKKDQGFYYPPKTSIGKKIYKMKDDRCQTTADTAPDRYGTATFATRKETEIRRTK